MYHDQTETINHIIQYFIVSVAFCLLGEFHSTEPREYLSAQTIIIIIAIVAANHKMNSVAYFIALGISEKEISQFLSFSSDNPVMFSPAANAVVARDVRSGIAA